MLIVLVGFPFLIWQAYKKLSLSKASTVWPTAPGFVTASGKIKIGWRTQPKVSFSYDVGGKSYTSSRISFAALVPETDTEPVLHRYQPNQPVVVHYQPENPAMGVLEPGPNRFVTTNLRNLIIWYVAIIFLNGIYLSVNAWLVRHSADTPAPAHSYGDTAKPDLQLGNRLLRESAEKGDAKDQVYVALWYLNGTEGYTKDPAEAAKWLQKAADQGNADGEYWLSILYNRGNGVEKNQGLAMGWLQKAAAQGEPHACFILGGAYEKGYGGLTQDTQKAIEWYRKAGDEPHAKEALVRLHASQ